MDILSENEQAKTRNARSSDYNNKEAWADSLPVTHELLVGKEIGDIMTLEEFDKFVGLCGEPVAEKGGSFSITTIANGKLQGHGRTRVKLKEFNDGEQKGFKIEDIYVSSIG
ncbi:MAG: hypothetical protein FWC00_05505 [Firmicutes bacterium]|nr:hypothetical protein [Bacillota bacterium]